jgi:phosphoserine phosphatase RsbU/P
MDGTNSNSGQRFSRVLREDFRNLRFSRDIKRELKELRDFYISEEQKQRLSEMRRVRGWFAQIGWMLKSLFLHLTPIRRLLTVVGVIFILLDSSVIVNFSSSGNYKVDANNNGLFGGILILVVLMLELKDKLLAKDELEAGRKVQRALTPERSPQISGWKVWLYTRPANEVGGDLVDYLKVNDDRVAVILADVAGKGLHAALLMAKLQATIRALAADYGSLSALCTKINNIFCRDSLPNIFASMLYMELKPDSPQIRYVNAGHFPPILIKNEEIEETEKRNSAIGLIRDFNYKEDMITMESGEILITYSDGVTEARNEFGQFYEKERFFKALKQMNKLKIENLGENIVRAVDYFVGDAPVHDDLSLIIIRKD